MCIEISYFWKRPSSLCDLCNGILYLETSHRNCAQKRQPIERKIGEKGKFQDKTDRGYAAQREAGRYKV